MRRRHLLSLALVGLTLVPGVPAHGKPKGKVLDRVVAAVGGSPILLSDVRRHAAQSDPVKTEREALEEMIDETLMHRNLPAAKASISAEDVDEGVEAWAKERGISKTELLRQLEARRHIKEQEVRDEVSRRLLRARWNEHMLRGRATPISTDAERRKRLDQLRREIHVEVMR